MCSPVLLFGSHPEEQSDEGSLLPLRVPGPAVSRLGLSLPPLLLLFVVIPTERSDEGSLLIFG